MATAGAPFEGKVAVVTGGGSGIGEAIVLALAARGARVVVADLNLDAARRVASAAGAAGGTAAEVQANVSDLPSVEAMVQAAVDTFGGLDLAVNNAGIGGAQALTGEYPPESWQQVLGVNLSGVFYCVRAEIRAMLARGGGAIVNMPPFSARSASPTAWHTSPPSTASSG